LVGRISIANTAPVHDTYAAGLRVSEVCNCGLPTCSVIATRFTSCKPKAKRIGIRCFRRGCWRSCEAIGALSPPGVDLPQPVYPDVNYRGSCARAFTDAVKRAGLPERAESIRCATRLQPTCWNGFDPLTFSGCSVIAGSRPRRPTSMCAKNAWSTSAVRWT